MDPFTLLVLAAAGLVSLGTAEVWAHRRNLYHIPHRIHVAGTRGKSSVTRLIAAGLREGGVRTAAKTTGTLARMILPDAHEVPVFRPAGANIVEQKRIVATARALGVDALVIECMALIPDLHWVAENIFVRATHGVITNTRADHLDVMGPTTADVARTLASMTPVKGVLFTAERVYLDILAAAAKDRGTRLVAVSEEDVAAITPADLAPFKWTEHAENVALALKVTDSFNIPRDVALQGMWKAPPDPGVLLEFPVDFFGRRITFVNAFAANDPESTERIWNLSVGRHPETTRTVAVFNMRADRPARTLQMAQQCDYWHGADRVVLMGTGAYTFGRMAAKTKFDTSQFVYADQDRVEEVFETIVSMCDSPQNLVIGMGNIGGPGMALVKHFRNRAVLPTT